MKRVQKTVRCPRCSSAFTLKARETRVGATCNWNTTRISIACWNCGFIYCVKDEAEQLARLLGMEE